MRSIDRGPNVKRGEINIRCPFCGSADPSFHMGLNLDTGFWACWRNRDHRGKSPLRLLVQLLGVSYYQARKLAGLTDDTYVDPDGFDAVAARIMGRDNLEKVEHVRREFLDYPREFHRLDERGSGRRFFYYLAWDRNFGMAGTRALADEYGVMYANRGPFKERVIFGYRDHDANLLGWTGRAIAEASIRYRDLETDDCIVPIKQTLLNLEHAARGGKVLVVCEGPIDALKVDVFGSRFGVRAVALSTNSLSAAQTYLLEEVAPFYEKVLVMMDQASQLGVVDSMRMRQDLRTVSNASIIPVPYDLKDAALMSPRQAVRWAEQLVNP